jgi:hypothetical protein
VFAASLQAELAKVLPVTLSGSFFHPSLVLPIPHISQSQE